ncbi:MAG: LysM peptidoglycan-binding domain-containing protein [Actinomycetales bacterium]|nr:LysM peptidoglycan-binding domain-containing protein [Actinomycetales bacterium]
MSTVAQRPPSLHIQASGVALANRLLPTVRPHAARTATVRTTTVRAGDTLAGIAAGHGVPLGALLILNPGIRARGLHVGQHVILPMI